MQKLPRERIELSTFRLLCSCDYETDALPTALSRLQVNIGSHCRKLCYFYVSACVLLAISSTKTSSSAGFEPATSGLEVRRAIHCATGT